MFTKILNFLWGSFIYYTLQYNQTWFKATGIWCLLLETLSIWWTGDPRICSANIIWINPDTTSWIRNRRKSLKGELAVDVVLEKSAIKQSGDAWRIVLDSCLPVLHLIDTRRSIPYAIKQVQELLGISCAFDQAVQVLYVITCRHLLELFPLY